MLIGYVLTGGEWHPPPPNYGRYPAHTMSVRQRQLPGGPVSTEKALIHNVGGAASRNSPAIPFLGDPPPPPVAAAAAGGGGGGGGGGGPPPMFLAPHAGQGAILSTAQRLHSPQNPAIVFVCEGAAVWTSPQIIRETIAGSWGVLPAQAQHVWRASEIDREGRTLWDDLMRTGRVLFATDVLAQAEAAEARAAAAAVSPAEKAAQQAHMGGHVREREARLLREAGGGAQGSTSLSAASQSHGGAPLRQVAACALPMHVHTGTGALVEAEARTLLGAIGRKVRFVLLGEASHGTQQFYEVRAALTRLLIQKRGFAAVVVEGDWPDAQRAHRYVSGRSLKDRSAAEALGDFGRRFPAWMWRNAPTEAFIEWLRAHNDAKADDGSAELPVGFYVRGHGGAKPLPFPLPLPSHRALARVRVRVRVHAPHALTRAQPPIRFVALCRGWTCTACTTRLTASWSTWTASTPSWPARRVKRTVSSRRSPTTHSSMARLWRRASCGCKAGWCRGWRCRRSWRGSLRSCSPRTRRAMTTRFDTRVSRRPIENHPGRGATRRGLRLRRFAPLTTNIPMQTKRRPAPAPADAPPPLLQLWRHHPARCTCSEYPDHASARDTCARVPRA